MVDDYRIRPTTPADLEALEGLEQSAFSDPWTVTMLEEALAGRGAVALVAVDATDAVIASVMARQVADEGEILTLAVDPAWRRRGIGRRLLAAALDQLGQGGVTAVWLEVRESNLAARLMYLSAGFIAAGVRRGYYRRPTEDAVILRFPVGASESAAGE